MLLHVINDLSHVKLPLLIILGLHDIPAYHRRVNNFFTTVHLLYIYWHILAIVVHILSLIEIKVIQMIQPSLIQELPIIFLRLIYQVRQLLGERQIPFILVMLSIIRIVIIRKAPCFNE
jgi:hypothetical protein